MEFKFGWDGLNVTKVIEWHSTYERDWKSSLEWFTKGHVILPL